MYPFGHSSRRLPRRALLALVATADRPAILRRRPKTTPAKAKRRLPLIAGGLARSKAEPMGRRSEAVAAGTEVVGAVTPTVAAVAIGAATAAQARRLG